MLQVRDLAKRYWSPSGVRELFSDLSFELANRGRLAILGRNGQGKSTLIKIIGGVIRPSAGEARWSASASWPLGFSGGFQGHMTGADNIRFLARIYDRPEGVVLERVDAFAELGEALEMPVRFYSSGMRARLAFGLSLAIEFDCYLIDEVIAVGDMIFAHKCEHELFEARADRAFVIATHDLALVRRTCERAIIIERGRAKVFDDIETAVAIYAAICDDAEARNTESVFA
jgi:capsular polysaccharide transport system ATP-binding protein